LTDIDQVTVLIPAAGPVPDGVLALSNVACPAMIPVGGRPVIYWTMNYLRSLGLRKFVFAVRQRGMFVEDFVNCTFGQDCQIEFIVPPGEGGLGNTVAVLAQQVRTSAVLVVLGDTHFQFQDAGAIFHDEPAVLVSQVEDSYRWCIAKTDERGYLSQLLDKQPDLPFPLNALIGVYYFPDREILIDASTRAVDAANRERRRAEMSAILININSHASIRVYPAADWLDCGNPDRQASSHRTLLQKRAFNELTIDETFGTVTKRSHNVDKFLDEINYFRLLPPDIAVLFPRVVDYSNDWSDAWIKLEYYGYPTLSEAFVFENVNPSMWERIFQHLHDIVTKGFMSRRRPLPLSAIQEMYLDKTEQRLAQLSEPLELAELVACEKEIVVNGTPLLNLRALWPQIEEQVHRMAPQSTGSIIHGDLCLSNILYDLRSRVCKLLDPRGSFGFAGIYGDPRYDVAKLYHSVYGLYDFIVNDLFHIELQGRQVQFELLSRSQHLEICRRFESAFFTDFDRQDILLITGLLFASMPALHYDAPRRQLAMYVRAVQLLNERFGNLPHSSKSTSRQNGRSALPASVL
jgi:dTDP-glucose pyrophosphorylase